MINFTVTEFQFHFLNFVWILKNEISFMGGCENGSLPLGFPEFATDLEYAWARISANLVLCLAMPQIAMGRLSPK